MIIPEEPVPVFWLNGGANEEYDALAIPKINNIWEKYKCGEFISEGIISDARYGKIKNGEMALTDERNNYVLKYIYKKYIAKYRTRYKEMEVVWKIARYCHPNFMTVHEILSSTTQFFIITNHIGKGRSLTDLLVQR